MAAAPSAANAPPTQTIETDGKYPKPKEEAPPSSIPALPASILASFETKAKSIAAVDPTKIDVKHSAGPSPNTKVNLKIAEAAPPTVPPEPQPKSPKEREPPKVKKEKIRCAWMIDKGINAGTQCSKEFYDKGSPYCSSHKKAQENKRQRDLEKEARSTKAPPPTPEIKKDLPPPVPLPPLPTNTGTPPAPVEKDPIDDTDDVEIIQLPPVKGIHSSLQGIPLAPPSGATPPDDTKLNEAEDNGGGEGEPEPEPDEMELKIANLYASNERWQRILPIERRRHQTATEWYDLMLKREQEEDATNVLMGTVVGLSHGIEKLVAYTDSGFHLTGFAARMDRNVEMRESIAALRAKYYEKIKVWVSPETRCLVAAGMVLTSSFQLGKAPRSTPNNGGDFRIPPPPHSD